MSLAYIIDTKYKILVNKQITPILEYRTKEGWWGYDIDTMETLLSSVERKRHTERSNPSPVHSSHLIMLLNCPRLALNFGKGIWGK